MRSIYDNKVKRYNYKADLELSYDSLLSKSIKCTLSFVSEDAIFRGFAKESELIWTSEIKPAAIAQRLKLAELQIHD